MPFPLRPALLAAALASLAVAQSDPPPARLLKDIGATVEAGSEPDGFTTVGAWTWFAATAGPTFVADRELYRTQGTPGTTERFLDLEPGPGGSNPSFLTALGTRLAFFARVGTGTGLWITDGTVAGTERVDPASNGIRPERVVGIGERLAFTRRIGATDYELWVSDGTRAGTSRVDLPGLHGRFLSFQTEAEPTSSGERAAYFTILGPDLALWCTDGTVAGTRQVAQIASTTQFTQGGASIRPGLLAFAATSLTGIWIVDVDAGSARLLGVPTGVRIIGRPTTFAGQAVFTSFGATDAILLATDGTNVTPIDLTGGTPGLRQILGELGGDLYLTTGDGRAARWRPGLATVEIVGTAPTPGLPAVRVGSRFYYESAGSAAALTAFDTASGTARTIQDGQTDAYGVHFGTLLFGGGAGPGQRELWRHDPIRDTTRLLANINQSPINTDSGPLGFTRYGERVVFDARDGEVGFEPWISDGTTRGTTPLGDLTPGTASSESRFYTVGDELWILNRVGSPVTASRSDGTAAGTRAFATIASGSNDAPVVAAAALDAGLVFGGRVDNVDGVFLLKADGTIERLAPTASGPFAILARGDEAFVVAASAPDQLAAWRTDGTPAGTTVLSGEVGRSGTPSLAIFDSRLWVASNIGISVSDAAGTAMTRVDPLRDATLLPGDTRLYAITNTVISSTTGTAAGFSRFSPGRLPLATNTASTLGDRLLFVSAALPFVSDGTALGTLPLLTTGLTQNTGRTFYAAGSSRAFFGAIDRTTFGQGLYVTDGTRAGTRRVDDVEVNSSVPTTLVPRNAGAVVAGRLFLSAVDPAVGTEPFVVDLGAIAEPVGGVCSADPLREIDFRADRAPVVGTAVTLSGRAAGATAAAMLVGLPAIVPFVIPGSGSCSIEVEPAGSNVLGPFPVDATGRFTAPLDLPNDRALLGLAATFQPLFAPGTGTRALDVGPALRVQLGN